MEFKACTNSGNSKKVCVLPLDDPTNPCPYKATDYNTNRCPAIKEWFHGTPSEIDNCCNVVSDLSYIDPISNKKYMANDNGLKASNLAGCGYGDMENKIRCHLWWADNPCAKKWLQWLQENSKGECKQYAWAYDEMKYYLPGDANYKFFNIDGNPSENHDISPLHSCSLNDHPYSFFEINITYIM